MEEKLITLVVLPYSKAIIFKMLLDDKLIECELEDMHLIQGDTSATVSVRIFEKDIPKAVRELEIFLGHKKPEGKKAEKPSQRQILVPVDFSLASRKAAKVAIDIAIHLNADVLFMHSFINPIIHSIPYSDIYAFDSSALFRIEHAESNANEEFEKFIKKLAAEVGETKWHSVQTDYIIKSGYAEEDILGYASSHLPRLIVLGSGSNQYPHGIVGSVTADIMYNATVPVLVVPKDAPEVELDKMQNVLYATNFDEKDFSAIEKLIGLLHPFNIRLTCVHVGDPRMNGWDMAKLEGMKELLYKKYEGQNFNCKLIEGNDVLETIDDYIKKEKVDLLSLTTHKRNMISRLFNPSLARKMVFHSHTPLLIFHA